MSLNSEDEFKEEGLSEVLLSPRWRTTGLQGDRWYREEAYGGILRRGILRNTMESQREELQRGA